MNLFLSNRQYVISAGKLGCFSFIPEGKGDVVRWSNISWITGGVALPLTKNRPKIAGIRVEDI